MKASLLTVGFLWSGPLTEVMEINLLSFGRFQVEKFM